jgi:hypothetical protein
LIQAAFDLHRRRIRNTSAEREARAAKVVFTFRPGINLQTYRFWGNPISARQNLPLSLSLESLRAKIGGKRAPRTRIQRRLSQANSSEKKTRHVSAHDTSYRMQPRAPLSAAINILICTGPSAATLTRNLMCQAKSAQHDGWSPPAETFPARRKAHTICQLWKLIFETRFLLGIINVVLLPEALSFIMLNQTCFNVIHIFMLDLKEDCKY